MIVNNRCTRCGKKDVAEDARDQRDADALCWCRDDDDEPTHSPSKETT